MRVRGSRLAAPRAALPLGLTLGLHLLLVLAWLARSLPQAPDDGKPPVSVLIPVLIPTLVPKPTPRPRLEPAASPGEPPPPARAAAAAPLLPSAATPASAAPEPAQDAPVEDPFASAARAAPSPPSLSADSELLGRARRAAGPIDRALRGGKSEIPTEPDTPWGRSQRALESAHVERSLSETRDRYTSPDGVVIYRARQRGRATCRQTGSVNFLPGGARSASYAGNIPCPKSVEWERY